MGTKSKAPLSARQYLAVLRVASGAALVGCCLAGVIMGFAGYRGDELETWRAWGASGLFLPALYFAIRDVRRADEAAAG